MFDYSGWHQTTISTLIGTNHGERLAGGPMSDWIIGRDGNDNITGEESPDLLNGGKGDDRISGGPANDLLIGGPGHDTLVFSDWDGGGNDGTGDTVIGYQPGRDSFDFTGVTYYNDLTCFDDITLTQLGRGVLVQYGGSQDNTPYYQDPDAFYLVDTNIRDVDPNDFIF